MRLPIWLLPTKFRQVRERRLRLHHLLLTQPQLVFPLPSRLLLYHRGLVYLILFKQSKAKLWCLAFTSMHLQSSHLVGIYLQMRWIGNQFPSFTTLDIPLFDVKALFLLMEWVKVEALEHPELNISSNVSVGTLVCMVQSITVVGGLDGDQITEMVIIYFEFLIGFFTNVVISFYQKKYC